MPSQSVPTHDSIAIVGGGIAGLCLAIGLLRYGVKCDIYEAAARFEEIGAGVGFGANACRALALIHPRLGEALQRHATNNLSPDKRETWFTVRLGSDDDGQELFQVPCKTGQTNVHRAEFLDEMVAIIPGEVAHFGKRLVSIEEIDDRVILSFEDGSSAMHPAVIACDGIKSRAREILLGADHPAAHAVFTGKHAYRGLVEMDEAVAELGEELAGNAQMYVGKGGHVISFPTSKGKLMNIVAFASKAEWTADRWVLPIEQAEMLEDYHGWGETARRLVSLVKKPDVWALFNHPPAPTCYKGRMCLMGDALHASTPHQGAGAGQAIEDALVMSKIMSGIDLGQPHGVVEAFELFGQYRLQRSQRQVETARAGGLLYDLQIPGVEDDLTKLRENMQSRMAWIWDYDLEGLLADIELHLAVKAK